jgi:hypothetical protein
MIAINQPFSLAVLPSQEELSEEHQPLLLKRWALLMPLYINTSYEMAGNHLQLHWESYEEVSKKFNCYAGWNMMLDSEGKTRIKWFLTGKAMVQELTFLAKGLPPERERQLKTAN